MGHVRECSWTSGCCSRMQMRRDEDVCKSLSMVSAARATSHGENIRGQFALVGRISGGHQWMGAEMG